MQNIDYSSVSIKSLKTLKLIYEYGSISAAAAHLEQNQSSVSYVLDTMRNVFDDQLFVRSGRGVKPTPRCHKLMPELDTILQQLGALLKTETFDLSKDTMEVTLSCNLYELSVMASNFIPRVHAAAPNLKLNFIQSQMNGHQQLQQGLCDILLSPMEHEYETLYRKPLWKERYVCVIADDHPLREKEITLSEYLKARHVQMVFQGGWTPFYWAAPELQGKDLDIALRIPNSAIYMNVLQGTDYIMTLPERMARQISSNTVVKAAPFDVTFQLYLYWTKMTHKSHAHEWVRQQIVELSEDLKRVS